MRRTLGKAALVVVVLIVVLGLWRGLPFLDMLIFGIALAVAVVPEALPAVATISLAIGVRRMVKRNAWFAAFPLSTPLVAPPSFAPTRQDHSQETT